MFRRFNDWLAVKVTNGVSTMWCAYAFAGLTLFQQPWAMDLHDFITWFAQTFLQLVLLSIIMVGQKVMSQHLQDVKETQARHGRHLARLLTGRDRRPHEE